MELEAGSGKAARRAGRLNNDRGLRRMLTEEIAQALAFALRYDGRKRVRQADEMMANIVADRLVRHLERSGFVIMRRPAMPGASISYNQTGRLGE
jgi:hypothetical protein